MIPDKSFTAIFRFAFPALLLTIAVNMVSNSIDTGSAKRVPAEWEPQEAIWLQWPSDFERVFQPAFARMTAIISRYETLNIVFDS